ncbi:MAG: SDR family oxidoreductase [Pseudomonadota bacterium]|nr:SDR family oxidoreductase [Pseudomonadota bacterium]
MKRFERKSVIVTGAASGIGAAVARRFLSEGANVAVVDLPDAFEDAPVIEDGHTALQIGADVSRSDEVNNTVAQTVDAFGRLDVLVNNAGILVNGRPVEIEDAALLDKFYERIPLGRHAEPDDIAGVVAFLASEDAGFINGVNLPVDGGLSASNGQPPQ